MHQLTLPVIWEANSPRGEYHVLDRKLYDRTWKHATHQLDMTVVATNRHDLTLAKVATQAGCLVKDAEDAPGEMKIRLHQTEEQN
jgi:hypothetical protein